MRDNSQGLTVMNTVHPHLRNREISMRKQVGDAESMVNEEKKPRDDEEDM